MDWFAPIDNYCERTDATFLSEPLNATTNIAFIIAAWLLLCVYQKRGVRDIPALVLIFMVAIVGLGSFLFHTYANRITMAADVLPIVLLVLGYIAVGYRRLAGFNIIALLSVYGAFFFSAFLLGLVPTAYALNGSIAYLPCLFTLGILAYICRKTHAQVAQTLRTATYVFLLSLSFRSVDIMLCDHLPGGTHFLWHSFNGILLYLVVYSIMQKEVPQSDLKS